MGSFVGIDLGTTFSAVAKIDEHGKPIIIHDSDGENITPSCVAKDPDSGKIEVGRYARREVYSGIGENAAARFKRKMGTSEVYTLGGSEYTPRDLSALVLEEMIRDRAEQIGEIEEVVITVPANFSNEAREATMEAARRAGLSANYIINEPTAAALCYSFREDMNLEGIYAIYDLGGGTFDISIIRIKGLDVEVLASDGVSQLGGIDFDEKLKELVEEKYRAETGEPMEKNDFTLLDAEDVKRELSRRERAVTKSINRKAIRVTRYEFEERISSMVAQAEMLCEAILEKAKLKPEDIRGVLCAGGSTRIPMVQESIKRVFAQDPIFKANVDEVVALGAALYAAYKGDHEKLSSKQREAITGIDLTERTNKCYGIIALSNTDGEIRRVNSILINRNTVIPCEVSKPYYTVADGQAFVECTVTEVSSEEITAVEHAAVVESHELPLPPGRPAGQKIMVTFGYDENQIMRCLFEDIETGEKMEIHHKINPKSDIGPNIDDFTVE